MERKFIQCLLIYFWSLGFSWAQPPDSALRSGFCGQDFDLLVKVIGEQENQKMVLSKMNQLHQLLNLHQAKFTDKLHSPKAARYLFKKVHQLFLKKYTNYHQEVQFFAKGEYDCVSGSAVMAFAFQQAGYPVEIHETPFHVYLIVRLATQQKVMLESTNAYQGFIIDNYLISELEKQHTFPKQEDRHPFHPSFNRVISLKELIGLQIYNRGVAYFNKQDFARARNLFQFALGLYPEDRIKALHQLSQDLMHNPQHQIVEQLIQLQKETATHKENELK